MQFCFVGSFAFMALEALQAYAVSSKIINSGGYMTKLQFTAFGWTMAGIITAVSALLIHSDYTSYWS